MCLVAHRLPRRVMPDASSEFFLSFYMYTETLVFMVEQDMSRYWWGPNITPEDHYIPVKVWRPSSRTSIVDSSSDGVMSP